MTPVLLLVDLQHDFLEAPGLEPHAAGVIVATARLLAACRAVAVPVVHVWSTYDRATDDRMPHWKADGRNHWACVEGSPGHACPEALRPVHGETVVHKRFFSAFSTGRLDDVLREAAADLLIVAGVHLHGCVRATALDAYARGYRVVVADDCVAGDDPLHAAITERYLRDRSTRFRDAAAIARALGDATAGAALLASDEVDATERAVAQALAVGKGAGDGWRRRGVCERSAMLAAFRDRLASSHAELVELLVEDIGKPVRYARQEVAFALALIDAACTHAMPEQDVLSTATGRRREPLGTVALISPFNNPLAIPVGKLAPALLHGNTVVWKPAAPGARIAAKTAELWAAATRRPEVLQVLCGSDRTAWHLMRGADAVTISGSIAAGRAAQEACAPRHVPLQAELGGNNAAIVWRDADLPAAAASITDGAFAFAGQRCTANRRVVVDARVYDEDGVEPARGTVGPRRDQGPSIAHDLREVDDRRVAQGRHAEEAAERRPVAGGSLGPSRLTPSIRSHS